MKHNLLALSITLICSNTLLASDQLTPIIIYGHAATNLGKSVFHQEELNHAANKNINALLTNLPSIRTSLDSSNSNTQGEITPIALSVYGERYYNNNFMINGISANDNINPIGLGSSSTLDRGRTLTIDPEGLPSGHPQAFWLSPDLIERVEIYDSNIPSQFGNFTGGVINSELREPTVSHHFGGVSYRTTRDSWTKFHFEGEYKDEFHKANSPLMQPKFIKHQFHTYINQPINHKAAILFAYDRQTSLIPQHQQYLKIMTKQKRQAETLLFSYKNEINENNTLLANIIYSPHFGDYYLDNVKDGKFRESGGGWLANIKWKHYNNIGLVTHQISYRDTKNQTKYDKSSMYDYYKTKSIDWVSQPDFEYPEYSIATEGGIGKRFTHQTSLQFTQSLDINKFNTNNITHEPSLGWEYQYNISKLKQPETAYRFNGASLYYHFDLEEPLEFDILNCTECIPKEQYFKYKTQYNKIDGRVKHNNFAFYLQDKLKWKNLTLIPGIRVDYGQFLKEWNIAPRFAIDLDLLGKGQTHIISGYNRYYATDLLDYQLRSKIPFRDEYSRTDYINDWSHTDSKLMINYKGGETKTPYSDELNLGINQIISNSLWELKWIKRDSKKQFMTHTDYEADPQKRWLTNSGKTKTTNVSLQVKGIEPIKLSQMEFNWKLSASYQKSRSNQTADYTQQDWKIYNIDKVLYKGKLDNIDKMPAQTFNSPIHISGQFSSYFPALNLTWLQQANYISGSQNYIRESFNCSAKTLACGNYEGRVVKLSETKYPREFTLDWIFIWKKKLNQHQSVTLDLSIFNILNRVAKAQIIDDIGTGQVYQTYKPGRQFWLGAKFEW